MGQRELLKFHNQIWARRIINRNYFLQSFSCSLRNTVNVTSQTPKGDNLVGDVTPGVWSVFAQEMKIIFVEVRVFGSTFTEVAFEARYSFLCVMVPHKWGAPLADTCHDIFEIWDYPTAWLFTVLPLMFCRRPTNDSNCTHFVWTQLCAVISPSAHAKFQLRVAWTTTESSNELQCWKPETLWCSFWGNSDAQAVEREEILKEYSKNSYNPGVLSQLSSCVVSLKITCSEKR